MAIGIRSGNGPSLPAPGYLVRIRPHSGAFHLKLLNPTPIPIIGGWRKSPKKMMHNGFVLQADGKESRRRRMLANWLLFP